MGVLDGEEKKKLGLFETIMIENTPNSVKEIDVQDQKVQSPK